MTLVDYVDYLRRDTSSYVSDTIVSFTKLLQMLDGLVIEEGFVVKPQFKRGTCWCEEVQRNYVESVLNGDVRLHSPFIISEPSSMYTGTDTLRYLLDGYNRYKALQNFVSNNLTVFGHTFSQYEGYPRSNINVRYISFSSLSDIIRWVRLNDFCTVPLITV